MREEEHLEEDEEMPSGRRARKERVFNASALRIPLSQLPPGPPVLIAPDQSVLDAIHLMQNHRAGCVLVCKDQQLIGLLTERDVIMKVPGRGRLSKDVRVEEIMTPDPVTLSAEDPLSFAMNYMVVGGYRHIPIVDVNGVPTGMVSMRGIMAHLVDFFPEEVLALPPSPQRNGPSLDGG